MNLDIFTLGCLRRPSVVNARRRFTALAVAIGLTVALGSMSGLFRLCTTGHCITVHILRMHNHPRVVHSATVLEVSDTDHVRRAAVVRCGCFRVLVVDSDIVHGQCTDPRHTREFPAMDRGQGRYQWATCSLVRSDAISFAACAARAVESMRRLGLHASTGRRHLIRAADLRLYGL
jgi:hypothetical protein